MARTLTEMITRGQRRLDEMPLDNPNWREDADHEMGEESEYQDALKRWYPGHEADQAGYFETPHSAASPVAADVEAQGQVDADFESDSALYDDYEYDSEADMYDDAAEELEQQETEHWAANASQWGRIAGIDEGEDDEEDSSGDVEEREIPLERDHGWRDDVWMDGGEYHQGR